MASRKKRRVEQLTGDKDYLSNCDQVCEELRELQWKSNCSTQTLQLILDALRGKLGRLVKEGDLPTKATSGDKTMQEMVHPAFVLFFISKLFFVTPHLGRGESSVVNYTVVEELVVKKSGDRMMRETCAICVVPADSMRRASQGSLLFTSHSSNDSKVF